MTDVDLIRGETFHGRKGAVANSFRYTVDYVLLNPDRAKGPSLFSRNRRNVTAVHDADYGGAPGKGRGTAWVREVLAAHDLPGADRSSSSANPASWAMSSTRSASGCAMIISATSAP
jgi:uncharacterized protein